MHANEAAGSSRPSGGIWKSASGKAQAGLYFRCASNQQVRSREAQKERARFSRGDSWRTAANARAIAFPSSSVRSGSLSSTNQGYASGKNSGAGSEASAGCALPERRCTIRRSAPSGAVLNAASPTLLVYAFPRLCSAIFSHYPHRPHRCFSHARSPTCVSYKTGPIRHGTNSWWPSLSAQVFSPEATRKSMSKISRPTAWTLFSPSAMAPALMSMLSCMRR